MVIDRRCGTQLPIFGKFVLCSNNERNPVLIEAAETRYWVRRVPPLPYDDQHLLAKMQAEIPGLLFYLQQRMLSSYEESRMWFAPRLLATDALRRIVHYNRSKTETEMLSIIHDIMEAENLADYRFDVSDMVNMLEIRGIRSDHPTVQRILAEKLHLPAVAAFRLSLVAAGGRKVLDPFGILAAVEKHLVHADQ